MPIKGPKVCSCAALVYVKDLNSSPDCLKSKWKSSSIQLDPPESINGVWYNQQCVSLISLHSQNPDRHLWSFGLRRQIPFFFVIELNNIYLIILDGVKRYCHDYHILVINNTLNNIFGNFPLCHMKICCYVWAYNNMYLYNLFYVTSQTKLMQLLQH